MKQEEIRLTKKSLNAYLWAKQGFGYKGERGVEEIAERTFGIYGTAPTCYLSLMARSRRFRFADLDKATVETKRLVRWRAMRVSQFLVPANTLPMVYQATKDLPQADFRKILRKGGVDDRHYQKVSVRIEELLADGPRGAKELRKEIDPDSEPLKQSFTYVMSQMCAEGRTVRAAASGGWRSDRYEYALLSDWLDTDLGSIEPGNARAELARRYFASYGPATAEDFTWWSGLSKRLANAALDALGNELIAVSLLGGRGQYLALAKERQKLRVRGGPGPTDIALLPVWDAYTMAYAARGRFLDPSWASSVIDRGGNVTSVVLVGGRVEAIWGFEELTQALKIRVAPFTHLADGTWRAIRQAGEHLAREVGKAKLALERCPPPGPLSSGAKSRYLSPLKGADGTRVG